MSVTEFVVRVKEREWELQYGRRVILQLPDSTHHLDVSSNRYSP
jgi:hypothetical protein